HFILLFTIPSRKYGSQLDTSVVFSEMRFSPPRFYPRTHPTRHFTKTTKRAIDDVFAEAAIPKSEGTRVLSHLERLTAVETILTKEVAIHRKAITDGFMEIKGWIEMMMVFGGGTIFFGFGSLAYKVMVYDVDAKKEMMAHTARVVHDRLVNNTIHESEEKLQTRFGSRVDNFEQKTRAQIKNLKLETKSEIDKLGHLVELSTKKR
ncbi:unnamed protein product, partial [Tuber aestivum]